LVLSQLLQKPIWPPGRPARRIAQLFFGLGLYGVSSAMIVAAGLGVEPWDALSQGLSRSVGLTIGVWTNLIGAAVLVLWLSIRQKPGLGTLCNILLVGTSMDLALRALPTPHGFVLQLALLVSGTLLNGIATGCYLGAEVGPGPRDGLMTGLVVRTGLSVRLIRTSIEASVLAAGWLLGGTVGVGTVLYAFGIGPLVQFFVRITPKRVLAVSGWASVADASDLGVRSHAERDRTRRNRFTTMRWCQSSKEIQPTPTC
jgi:uncharacterized membrane protein YczE